jgi:DNA-binding LytR/AlgR family response regulator
VWREVIDTLLFISAIAVANLLYTSWRFENALEFSWGLLLAWWRITFSVGFFPVVFGVFAKELRLSRRYARETAAINAHLPEHQQAHPPASTTPEITLTGDNQGETLRLSLSQLLYCEAADNYVQVVFTENGQPRQRLLRTTLRRVEDALVSYPQVYRCHRTYLVNLDHVEHLSGNAQGYRLHLTGTDTLVPVSRSLNADIQQRLN